jgi:hypothetical protein
MGSRPSRPDYSLHGDAMRTTCLCGCGRSWIHSNRHRIWYDNRICPKQLSDANGGAKICKRCGAIGAKVYNTTKGCTCVECTKKINLAQYHKNKIRNRSITRVDHCAELHQLTVGDGKTFVKFCQAQRKKEARKSKYIIYDYNSEFTTSCQACTLGNKVDSGFVPLNVKVDPSLYDAVQK